MELVNHIRACSNTEIAGFADVYAKRLETASGTAPGAAIHRDYRSLLDDPAVDAVIIATPQHLHAQQFCDAIAAGKHVYLEKAMALSVAQAKQMRAV
jgi:predicted dehydrogenase